MKNGKIPLKNYINEVKKKGKTIIVIDMKKELKTLTKAEKSSNILL